MTEVYLELKKPQKVVPISWFIWNHLLWEDIQVGGKKDNFNEAHILLAYIIALKEDHFVPLE